MVEIQRTLLQRCTPTAVHSTQLFLMPCGMCKNAINKRGVHTGKQENISLDDRRHSLSKRCGEMMMMNLVFCGPSVAKERQASVNECWG